MRYRGFEISIRTRADRPNSLPSYRIALDKKAKRYKAVSSLAMEIGTQLPDRPTQAEIRKVIDQAIASGVLNERTREFKEKSPRLSEYLASLFSDFDKSPWVERRAWQKGSPLVRGSVGNYWRVCRLYIIPNISAGKTVRDFTREDFRMLNNKLQNICSRNNYNKALGAMRAAFDQALQDGLSDTNPVRDSGWKSLTIKSRERVILDDEEYAMFIGELRRRAIAGKNKFDMPIYLMFRLSGESGMRSEEYKGLTLKNFRVNKNNPAVILIDVDHSWHEYYHQVAPTKNKKKRTTGISAELYEMIRAYALSNPYGTEWVFWSPRSKGKPISQSCLREHQIKVLEAIGISKDVRAQRRIDVHSIRHFMSTRADKANLETADAATSDVIMRMLGHEGDGIHALYTHLDDERAVRDTQRMLDYIGNTDGHKK